MLNERIAERDNIVVMTDRSAVDLITDDEGVKGIYVLNGHTSNVDAIKARCGLATGGASKAYLYTSNPDGATGDGITRMSRMSSCQSQI